MSCENYRKALTEAAAADAVPSLELRSHLDACASCRAALTEELQLFAAIDVGLRGNANPEVPTSLFPRVRAQLNVQPLPPSSWIPASAAIAVAAALVLAIVFVRGFGRHVAEPTPQISSDSRNTAPAEIQPAAPVIDASETTHALAKSRSVQVAKAAPTAEVAGVTVLIPAGQKQAIDAFLKSVQQAKVDGDVLLAEKSGETLQELEVSPLKISPIEMKPLEDVSAESASPNEKTLR